MVQECPMHAIGLDIQSAVTYCGRRIRFVVRLAECTPTTLAIVPSRSFKAAEVVALEEGVVVGTGIGNGSGER